MGSSLAHSSVGALWTHNGWNSTLESICKGFPMICMPCFTDQRVNARYVSDVWRVGLQLENGNLERGEIEKLIRRLMVEKEGEEIRERILGLKEKASLCLKEGGSSYESINSLDCLAELLGGGDDDDDVACLITDAVWYFTQAVADTLKLPRIVLFPTSVSFYNPMIAVPLLYEKGCLPMQDFQLETPVPEIPPLRYKDLPIVETHDPESFIRFSKNVVKQTKASSGIIWNSFQELEELALTNLKQEFPIPNFPIGPFHKYFPASSSSLIAQDQTSISWLDKQPPKSVIYVSFGSLAVVNKTEFQEIAWGLANSKLPFLLVVRPGLVRGTEWLESLPKNFMEMLDGRGHIVKWAPQQEVLAHSSVGAFWTHNGWNSTLESICEGVPMICQPGHGDQLVNARYVCDVWRFGLHLEKKVERGEIERAIRRVILEAEGQKMRERIMILKDKMDICLKPGAIHLLYENGCLPMQDFQFETPVLEIPPLRYKDIPIVDTHDPENLNRFLKDMVKQTKVERGEIERAIRRVILEAEGQKMRERIMILKDKMDTCLKTGGSSYQSLESLINYIMSF
ncbi:hypothetical protein LWI29_029316 [Acer saccharum]|uniref:Uncharacterized protein n=1 Tax=Acer saccharum TaxID=4024 RepID=A0AA39VU89_ACESA|nr:hypothetical protein LWI29_029316 [Acer saccharum]